MKKMLIAAAALLVILSLSAPVSAQTILNNTTLSAAVTSTQTTIAVATTVGSTVGDLVVIPGFMTTEAMRVTAILSATQLRVVRGVEGTRPSAHSNGLRVWIDHPNRFYRYLPKLDSPVTYANQPWMPWIDISTGIVCTSSVQTPATTAGTWNCTTVSVLTFNSIGQLR